MARSKFGFSFSTNSQAAFSAKVCHRGVVSLRWGPKSHRNGREREVPYLTCSIYLGMVESLLPSHRIPDSLVINFLVLVCVDDRSKGRSYDHPLHRWRVLLNGAENARCSFDRGVEEVLHGVLNVEMKRRCGMKDIIERRVRFHSLHRQVSSTVKGPLDTRRSRYLIKCPFLGNILNHNIRECIFRGVWMRMEDSLTLCIRSNCHDSLESAVIAR